MNRVVQGKRNARTTLIQREGDLDRPQRPVQGSRAVGAVMLLAPSRPRTHRYSIPHAPNRPRTPGHQTHSESCNGFRQDRTSLCGVIVVDGSPKFYQCSCIFRKRWIRREKFIFFPKAPSGTGQTPHQRACIPPPRRIVGTSSDSPKGIGTCHSLVALRQV